MRYFSSQIISLLLVAMLVSGCLGTSEQTRYYALNNADIPVNHNTGPAISVGPVQVPDYLNRPNIVIRNQESTSLQVLKFDRWAEPLNEAITRRLVVQLSADLDHRVIVQFPSLIDVFPEYRVRGRITSFEADTAGVVRLSLRWGVQDIDGQFVFGPKGANFQTSVTSSDDIAAVTEAMGMLLDELAAQIATELKALGID